MNFNLNVAFTNEQLSILYATGTNVIIAKPTGGAQPNVAWQVFRPMQNNTLSWNEEYGMYASTSVITNGSRLNQMSTVPVGAAINKLYTLEPSGVISGPSSGGANGAYCLLNQYPSNPYMTFGLSQDATVNGITIPGNAVSAAPVLLASTVVMMPSTPVFIWLQSQVASNTIVTSVYSPMTRLNFGGATQNLSVAYDSYSGQFISNGAQKMAASDETIEHISANL